MACVRTHDSSEMKNMAKGESEYDNGHVPHSKGNAMYTQGRMTISISKTIIYNLSCFDKISERFNLVKNGLFIIGFFGHKLG